MRTNYLKTVLFLLAAVMVVLVSCEQKELIEPTENMEHKSCTFDRDNFSLQEVQFSHGMLVFQNQKHYESVLAVAMSMPLEEILEWQNDIGFVSQQSILEKSREEEEKFFEQFQNENMTKSEIEKLIRQKEKFGFSEYTKKYIKSGLLKIVNYDGITSLELTTEAAVLPIFLNIDGTVKIGDVIMQYTDSQCKQITDGDFSKISLLKESAKSNPENSIEIGNLVDFDKSDYHGYLVNLITKTNGRYRITTGIKLRIWDYPSSRQFYYYIQYMNYKEKWFFGWRWKEDSNADTDIWGSLKITISGESPQYYNLNYSRDNLWSDHVAVAGYFYVNKPKTVTFSNASFTVDRDNVSGVSLSHGSIVK